MPAKPKAPSPSSRQTWRSGWASLAPIAWPGPGAEAAERARVHPAARLVGVDEAAGVGDEVAAVADDDRVAVEHLAQLPVDADRVQRRARVVRAPPARRRASPPRRSRSCSSQGSRPRLASAGRLARSPPGWRRRRRPGRRRGSAVGGQRVRRRRRGGSIFVSSPKLPPKPSRKSIGTPTTSATSAPFSAGAAGAAEGELVVGGQAAAAEAVEEDRDAERLGQRPQLAPRRGPSRGRCRP